MYLRETNRRNKDGSTVRYLQLAHNYRDPETGVSKPQIIHNSAARSTSTRTGYGG